MKITLNTYEAANMLLDDDNANWSSAGSLAMVRYLEDLEDELGEEMEFDVIAIRCDYSEYESLIEWAEGYFGSNQSTLENIGWDGEDPGDIDDLIRSHILDHGQLVEFPGGIVVSHF